MTPEAKDLLAKANVEKDPSVIDVSKAASAFFKVAASRQWDREPKLRPTV
jgi:catalase